MSTQNRVPHENMGVSLYFSSSLNIQRSFDIYVNGIIRQGGGTHFPKVPAREPHPAGASASVLATVSSRTITSQPWDLRRPTVPYDPEAGRPVRSRTLL